MYLYICFISGYLMGTATREKDIFLFIMGVFLFVVANYFYYITKK